MGQGAQAFIPKIIRLRMNGLVLLGCTFSLLAVLLITPSAQALSLNVDLRLEDGVVSPLTRLLSDDNARTNDRTASTPAKRESSPLQAGESTPSASRQAPRKSENAKAAQAFDESLLSVEMLQPFDEPLESIATIPAVSGVATSRESSTAVSTAEKQLAMIAPLQATEEGWRIFGYAWYWWVCMIIGLSGAAYVRMKYWEKRSVGFAENTV